MPVIRNISSATVATNTPFNFKGAWSLTYELQRSILFKPPSGGVFLPPLPTDKRVYGELVHNDPDAAEKAFNMYEYVDIADVSLEIVYPYNGKTWRKTFFPVIFGAVPGGDELRTVKGADGGDIILQTTRFILAMPANGNLTQYIFTEEI
jgi:hypothetical protein